MSVSVTFSDGKTDIATFTIHAEPKVTPATPTTFAQLVSYDTRPASGAPVESLLSKACDVLGIAGEPRGMSNGCDQPDEATYIDDNRTTIDMYLKQHAKGGHPTFVMIEKAQWDPTALLNEIVPAEHRGRVFLYTYM
jgi:hypothetical protein